MSVTSGLNNGENLDEEILPAHPRYASALVSLLVGTNQNPDQEFFRGKQVALNIKTIGQTLRSRDRVDSSKINITGEAKYTVFLGVLNGQGFVPHRRFSTGELALLQGMDGLAVADTETSVVMDQYGGLIQVLYNGQPHRDIVSYEGELVWDDKGMGLRPLNK